MINDDDDDSLWDSDDVAYRAGLEEGLRDSKEVRQENARLKKTISDLRKDLAEVVMERNTLVQLWGSLDMTERRYIIELLNELAAMATMRHDDGFCPLSEDGLKHEWGKKCMCGAEKHNERIKKIVESMKNFLIMGDHKITANDVLLLDEVESMRKELKDKDDLIWKLEVALEKARQERDNAHSIPL